MSPSSERSVDVTTVWFYPQSFEDRPQLEPGTIKTFITTWNDILIQEAVLRELKRGGQVYFLHNEVETIENMARFVAARQQSPGPGDLDGEQAAATEFSERSTSKEGA